MAVRAIAQSTASLLDTQKNNAGGSKVGNKYHNRKTTVDGVVYDSAKEARRGAELRLMEKAGLISNLQAQVKFTLIPAQRQRGKVVERAATYIADFVYTENGKTVVEDVKSPATRTDVYRLKKKLMLYKFGIAIKEV